MKKWLILFLLLMPIVAFGQNDETKSLPLIPPDSRSLGEKYQAQWPPAQYIATCSNTGANCVKMAGYYNGVPLWIHLLADGTVAPLGSGVPEFWCIDCIPVAGNYNGTPIGIKVDANGNLVIASSGSVSSVGLAAPTGIQIFGSPVTGTGTLTWAMPVGWNTGDLLIGNFANGVARLPIGTSTYVLTSNGSTASWQPPTGGGGAVPGGVPTNCSSTAPDSADTVYSPNGISG